MLGWGFVSQVVESVEVAGAEDVQDVFGHRFVGVHRKLLRVAVAALAPMHSCLVEAAETGCIEDGLAEETTGDGRAVVVGRGNSGAAGGGEPALNREAAVAGLDRLDAAEE